MKEWVKDSIKRIKSAKRADEVDTVNSIIEYAQKYYNEGKITDTDLKELKDERNKFHQRIANNSNSNDKGGIVSS